MNSTIQDPVDPAFKKAYVLDYSDELVGTVKLLSSAWVLPDELASIAEAHDDTTTTITINFAAATIGLNYAVYNDVGFDSGEARRRALLIPVRDAAMFSAKAAEYLATLEAIRAALKSTATRGQLRRQIGDKTIEWMSIEELLKAETRFQQLYNAEIRRARGEPFMTTIHTRFVG